MMAWTTPCFTAFLRCPYRIEQYLQRSKTWLLMQHIRHEQFPQANSDANSFVYAANDSTVKKKQNRFVSMMTYDVQFLQSNNSGLLTYHIRHEQFLQANSGANQFVHAALNSMCHSARKPSSCHKASKT